MLGSTAPLSGAEAGGSFNYGPASIGLAAAGLGLQGLGGILGNAGTKKQIHWQREQLQKGIQYRVADAKAAGIHPLYALGAQIQSPSPIQVGNNVGESLQSMGQGLGQLSQRFQVAWERQMTQAQLGVLATEAEKNTAMAQFYRSQAVNPQVSSTPQTVVTDRFGNIPGQANYMPPIGPGLVNPKANDVYSTAPGSEDMAAGRNPMTAAYTIAPGLDIPLGHSNEGAGEALENTPMWMIPGRIIQYSKQYGSLAPFYVADALGSLLYGKTPRVNWNKMKGMNEYQRMPSRFESTFNKIKQDSWSALRSKNEESKRFWKEFQSDVGGDPWRWKKWFPNR